MSIKIYPSSATRVIGQSTNGYKEQCPTYVWARHEYPKPREDIHDLYWIIGRTVERRVRASLDPNLRVELEVPVNLPGTDSTPEISGRVDMITYPEDGPPVVWEIKSTLSRWKFNTQIRKNDYVDDKYLAQLITYMVMLKMNHGILSVTYVHWNRKGTELQYEKKELKVQLVNDVKIYIDGKMIDTYDAGDIVKYYRVMFQAITGDDLPQATLNERACSTCPFENVCDLLPSSKEQFRSRVAEYGEKLVAPMPEPVLQQHDVRS